MRTAKKEKAIRLGFRLGQLGVSPEDARQLATIEAGLHRWHERLCVDVCKADDGTCEDVNGRKVRNMGEVLERRVRDIMGRYPGLTYHVQRDPRGCALYVMPAGETEYTNGVAVCL